MSVALSLTAQRGDHNYIKVTTATSLSDGSCDRVTVVDIAADAWRQITHYYPFGTPYTGNSSVMGDTFQPYNFSIERGKRKLACSSEREKNRPKVKYNGKELDRMHGLDTYDYGARMYEPGICRFMTMDPLCEKYYSISPYAYCHNNPVRYIDPDGRTVEADSLSQMNIINTVTPEEAEYIQFDENGVINVDLINKCNSTSENFLSIKQLALSENLYVFNVVDKDHEGKPFYDDNRGNYHRGVTEMPGAECDPSPNHKVYILAGSCLSAEEQAMTTAHEAYGHGYLYDITRSVDAASHKHVSDESGMEWAWDVEFNRELPTIKLVDSNAKLANRINIVMNQAKNNYERRIK